MSDPLLDILLLILLFILLMFEGMLIRISLEIAKLLDINMLPEKDEEEEE